MDQERPYSRVIERLKGAGLRPTRQRLALARLLFDGPSRHVTAELLHEETVAANIRVSLATVYNTLNQFTAAGLLREVVVDPGRSYFDTNTSEHHHFFVEATGNLLDISKESVTIADIPAPPEGMDVESVEVVVRLVERPAPKG